MPTKTKIIEPKKNAKNFLIAAVGADKKAPKPKKVNLEYRVKSYFKYDSQLKKQFYVISIFTVKEFSSLNYEISVDVKKNKKNIDIHLLGLNTRQNFYMQARTASCDLFFEDLYGEHIVSIIKQDGNTNQFVIDYNIFKKEIKLKEFILPKKTKSTTFSDVEIITNLFTFKGE